jgi:hypothetical protein
MSIPKLIINHIERTPEHLAGFAHVHPMEHHSASVEHIEGSLFKVTQMLTRETHSLDTPDLGQFVFDVTSIKAVLARKLVDFAMFRASLTQEWVDYTFKTGGCEEDGVTRLKEADFDRPGIMVWFGAGRTAMIDGNHRLVGSWRAGRKTYDLALVPVVEIAVFMCRPGAEDVLMETAKSFEEELGRL